MHEGIKGYALEDEVDALVVPEVAVHAQDVLVPVRAGFDLLIC